MHDVMRLTLTVFFGESASSALLLTLLSSPEAAALQFPQLLIIVVDVTQLHSSPNEPSIGNELYQMA